MLWAVLVYSKCYVIFCYYKNCYYLLFESLHIHFINPFPHASHCNIQTLKNEQDRCMPSESFVYINCAMITARKQENTSTLPGLRYKLFFLGGKVFFPLTESYEWIGFLGRKVGRRKYQCKKWHGIQEEPVWFDVPENE